MWSPAVLLATKAVLDRAVANPGKADETSPLPNWTPTKKAHEAHRQFSIRWKLTNRLRMLMRSRTVIA
jgi:hypothetical protein